MDNNAGTILTRKKTKVHFTDDEVISILRAYIANPASWTDIIADVKGNADRLPEPARQLFSTATNKQLRDRMSTKLSSLIAKDQESVQNELLMSIRNIERRLVDRSAPPVRKNVATPAKPTPMPAQMEIQAPGPAPKPVPLPGPARAPTQADMRDGIAAGMPSSSSDTDGRTTVHKPANGGKKRRGKKRKQSLAELVRGNQLLYKRWMTKKLPKIERELGISSDSSMSSDDE